MRGPIRDIYIWVLLCNQKIYCETHKGFVDVLFYDGMPGYRLARL